MSVFSGFKALAFFSLIILVVALPTPCASADKAAASKSHQTTPDDWAGFKTSTNPEDKRLVATIEKMEWWNACRDFGRARRSGKQTRRFVALREYLLAQNLMNGIDVMNVAERQIAVGMTACGVMASLGLPDTINNTTTASRTRAQMVYRSRRIYVYTEASADDGNGIVTSWQH